MKLYLEILRYSNDKGYLIQDVDTRKFYHASGVYAIGSIVREIEERIQPTPTASEKPTQADHQEIDDEILF